MQIRRREFVGTLASAAWQPAAPAIAKIEVFPVIYPVTGYFKFFPKPERPAVFVKVTCEDGTFGWGESVPVPTWSYETPESVVSALRLYLAPALLHKNPTDLAGAHAAMNKAIAPSFSTGMPIAKAGIDIALHDIAGKLAGKNLAALWERKPLEKIVLSWRGANGRKQGYQHINIKVAPDPKFDVELVKAVRKFDAKCFLWADANGGYDIDTALTVLPKLKRAE